MARMWRGPCAELTAARADPLWAALHRRNARLGVFCDITKDGRTAHFYTLEQASSRCGTMFRHDLGRVEGPDPYFNCLWGSHDFTTPDAELFALHHAHVVRLIEQVEDEVKYTVKQLGKGLLELSDMIENVRA